ncbi:MAG: hypothetical protein ACO35F_10585, partial [Ilumatobacteraceae bacterium]
MVIPPFVLRAAPAAAPAAPKGAKVIAVGDSIQHSQEVPKAPAAQVAPGELKAMFGGVPVETEVQTSTGGVALMSAGPAIIALAGFAPSSFATTAAAPLEIATSSFIASTPVQVWLFSTPMLLAETTVDADGNFAGAISLPSSLPGGNHTLQIQGFVYASGGAAEVTANIGISVTRTASKEWSATFPLFRSTLPTRTKSSWESFVASQPTMDLSCALTPTSPASRSAANLRLFDMRMLSMTTMLKLRGCSKITTNPAAPLTKKSSVNRTWNVTVEPQDSDIVFTLVHEFSLYSSVVRRAVTTSWTSNIAAYANNALVCQVTGVLPITMSRANNRLFSQRNAAIYEYLSGNGCTTVEFTIPIGPDQRLATRRLWIVRVRADENRPLVVDQSASSRVQLPTADVSCCHATSRS